MNSIENENLILLKLCSLLLSYPTEDWITLTDWRDEIRQLTNPNNRNLLNGFLHYLDKNNLEQLCANYVETFDFSEKSSLHLTYHEYGNGRNRGQALVDLKNQYAKVGYHMMTDELPDYLPLMLEFCAEIGDSAIKNILYPQHSSIAKIHAALTEGNNDYKPLLEVCLAAINESLMPEEANR
ncbi:nitrate reductase molybdenum cofactor assembly chaperone [Pelosinus sp. sgz500959]|uniref:nitrate reductase molybdenum cofactor assembly chaperone n=1 Tax=Pelosinus sp. sgz500959 TaxID=3242472 RepID=UPI00367356F9